MNLLHLTMIIGSLLIYKNYHYYWEKKIKTKGTERYNNFILNEKIEETKIIDSPQ